MSIFDTQSICDVVEAAIDVANVLPTSTKAANWTDDELAFLKRNLGHIAEAEIAAQLGRSLVGVHLKWRRKGWDAPSKLPGFHTANGVADMLDKDVHAICKLIERGLLAAELVPLNDRKIWRVSDLTLRRFVIRPTTWLYCPPERYKDRHLRRLALLARERWGDEWLTTAETATMHDCHHKDIYRYIVRDKLPAVRWDNWHVRRSDAEKIHVHKGRGSGHEREWSRAGDEFILLCRGLGFASSTVARMMGWETPSTYNYRARLLLQNGVEEMAQRLPVRVQGGEVLTDWHAVEWRFPTLSNAVERYGDRDPLSPHLAENVRSLLYASARFHLGLNAPLTRRLQIAMWYRQDRSGDKLRSRERDLIDAIGESPLA